jgi:hypothetical protein
MTPQIDGVSERGARMIRISVKGLAKFMTASAANQRKILRDYKYPDEEGTAQAGYYREARDLIAKYHQKGHQPSWLREKANVLSETASALGGRVATRLRHNVRTLNDYADHFPGTQFEVLPERKFFVSYGPVRVSIVPDLHVRQKTRERFIKLGFGAKEPSPEVVKIVSQLMFEAAVGSRVPVKASDVLYIDVARGVRHKGARAGARMVREIEAACENIGALWPTI